jgi:hypothetical protein
VTGDFENVHPRCGNFFAVGWRAGGVAVPLEDFVDFDSYFWGKTVRQLANLVSRHGLQSQRIFSELWYVTDEFWLNIGDPVRVERFTSAGIDLIAAAQEKLRTQK